MSVFNFFTERKNQKVARELVENIYLKLRTDYPDLYENSKYWKIKNLSVIENQIRIFNISYENEYVEKNKKKNYRFYKVSNILVKSKKTTDTFSMTVNVSSNLINNIETNTENLYKSIDPKNIDISEVTVEEHFPENSDKKTLLLIIEGIDEVDHQLLEIDDTFEIEFAGKKFYTLLDMEDGNYVAINKKREIFRLHHDSGLQAKKIYSSLENFLENYSGNKKDLEYLFD